MEYFIVDKNDCCGCSVCSNICPKNAITMIEDSEGFCYPEIDKNKCINCWLCKQVCPVINVKNKKSLLQAYAAYNLNEIIRLESSSGGIFSLFAEEVFDNNGIVYGAAFDENFEVKHIRVTEKSELYKLRGSKYVQSKCDYIYSQCKNDLKEKRIVLFSGTPCQIEALKSFLKVPYDNLYCVDIICHGVPSRLVWRKYLQYRINFAKSKIEQIAFRLKNEGWKQYAVQFVFSNRTAYCQNLHKDIFMRGFLKNLYLRPSCYACKFKTKERRSDITIADFWGISNIDTAFDDDKGTSLIIIHSEKGLKIFDKIKEKIVFKSVDFKKAIKYNPSMISSVKCSPKRKNFFEELSASQNIENLIQKYSKKSLREILFQIIKLILLKLKLFNFVKRIVKQIKNIKLIKA